VLRYGLDAVEHMMAVGAPVLVSWHRSLHFRFRLEPSYESGRRLAIPGSFCLNFETTAATSEGSEMPRGAVAVVGSNGLGHLLESRGLPQIL
jgi:hypothetical protein